MGGVSNWVTCLSPSTGLDLSGSFSPPQIQFLGLLKPSQCSNATPKKMAMGTGKRFLQLVVEGEMERADRNVSDLRKSSTLTKFVSLIREFKIYDATATKTSQILHI